ncbi:MAG: MgtC/SapB family protein [Parcubacteria group bacterium]|nr:MgtC/SapB family protein [Parcubacteria group bacterium]
MIFTDFSYEILIQLILAVILGAVIGFERTVSGKAAGLRTYALVTLGSTIFTILSRLAFRPDVLNNQFDPTRIAAQIVVGIGFIGAGLIVIKEQKLQGLTTAAGLWTAAAVGMAIGAKFYFTALSSVFLIVLILAILRWARIEERFSK